MLGARALATIATALLVTTGSTTCASMSTQQQQQGLTLQLHRVAEPTHSETYRRRRLQNVDGKFEVMPLNPGLGTHYAWVYAGTPPQRASVITDTGSSLMAFPCSGCVGCGEHTDAPFVVSNSSTLTHVTCANAGPFFKCKSCDAERSNMCSISQAYMEGSSWEATVVEDIVYLGGANSSTNAHMRNQFGTHFMFGCQKKETGLFITQVADGIMGLSNNDNNIVAKLHKEQKIPNKLFSLCFADDGGSMSIGVPDTARHKGAVAYAKLGPDQMHTDFYNVVLKDVRVGNVSINAPAKSYSSGHFIVDSGTTDSYFPVSMKSAFEAAFEHVAGLKYQTSGASCTGLTDEQVEKLPTLQVVLESEDGGDLVLDVTPEQYLIQEKHGYCANVFLSEFSGGVIGANIMLNRDVIFDSERKRVGFVDADCTYRDLETVIDATPSPSPRNHPAPGVVATSETHAPNVMNATAAPGDATIEAPTSTPVPPPTRVPTPSPTPEPTPPPTPAPTPSPTPEPTSAPTPSATAKATATPKPTTIDATVSLNANDATPVPTATTNTKGKHSTEHEEVDEHPMVLTIVGTVLVLVFLLVVAASIKFNRSKKDHNWSRVKENEEEEEDDDDDEDERDSSGGRRSSRAKSPKKKKAPLRSDEVDSDDDDDDDDEDEIFDRSSAHDDTKHDTRMLERL